MLLRKCVVCVSKKSGGSILKSSLAIKIPILSELPLVSDILFKKYKMNEMVKKFLLAGDKFRLEMHLRLDLATVLPGNLLKPKKENKKLKKLEIRDIFIKTNLTKLTFLPLRRF